MTRFVHITPDFAVTGEMTAADFRKAARLGFRTVISNRPDDEEADQVTHATEARLAVRASMSFHFVPAGKLELFSDATVTAMAQALAAGVARGPVLAHCKSGMRSAILWAAVRSRSEPVAGVLAAVADAGFDLEAFREEFDAQATRHPAAPRVQRRRRRSVAAA